MGGETVDKKCDLQSPICESSASKFPLSRTDIAAEERSTDSVTSVREKSNLIPASCPPKRRSLMQENMNEEVMIKDTKKAPTKEKLLLEFEGRDSSERNANAELRQDKGLRKQREDKEGGSQKEMTREEERKVGNDEIKGRGREANGDSDGKSRGHEAMTGAKREEEQKLQERKNEEEMIVLNKIEEKRKIDKKIDDEKRKEKMLLERKKKEEKRKEAELQQRVEQKLQERKKEEEMIVLNKKEEKRKMDQKIEEEKKE